MTETSPESVSEPEPSSTPTTSEADAASILASGAASFMVADDPELTGGDQDEAIVQLDAEGDPVEREQPAEFELMSEDQFFEQFRLIFDGPQDFDPDWAPLAIPDKELKGARLVSDRIYRRCANSSIKWLRDFVNLNGSALLDWTLIGAFVYGRGRAVGEIMVYKQAKAQHMADAQIAATTGNVAGVADVATAAHVDPNSEGAYASPQV